MRVLLGTVMYKKKLIFLDFKAITANVITNLRTSCLKAIKTIWKIVKCINFNFIGFWILFLLPEDLSPKIMVHM